MINLVLYVLQLQKNERKCPESSLDYFITRFFKDRRRTIEIKLELSGSVCFKKRTNYFFIHDNEFSHLVLSVRQFFADISFCFHWFLCPNHPLYSPDFDLCDFLLFSQMQSGMRGKTFNDIKYIKRKKKPGSLQP